MKKLWRKFEVPGGRLALRKDQAGVIIVIFALMLPIIVGFVGLGVETGLWFSSRREVQGAADAAAIAAAYEIRDGSDDSTILTSATTEATRNGYDFANGDTLTINVPTTGSYTGDTAAREVNLTKQIELLFSAVLISEDVTVNGRAVARVMSGGDACVLALDTSGSALSVSGSADITFENCVTASNSTDADAIASTGSGNLTTDCYYAVGGVSDTSQMTLDDDCSPRTNASALEDPYEDLTDPGGTCAAGYESGYTHNVTTSISIGHAAGSPDYVNPFVICGDLWLKKGTVTLNPGLYVIDGGDLKSNAQGNLVGTGVTIVLRNNAQINNFNGSSTVTLSAPDTDDSAGDWEGILFYQDRDTSDACTGNNCNTLNGNSSTSFTGVVYFPNQEINVNGGNEGSSTCLQIVALRVGFSGNGSLNASNDPCDSSGVPPIETPGAIQLVE